MQSGCKRWLSRQDVEDVQDSSLCVFLCAFAPLREKPNSASCIPQQVHHYEHNPEFPRRDKRFRQVLSRAILSTHFLSPSLDQGGPLHTAASIAPTSPLR